MQISRLGVISRDETQILGYQLQVTATNEEWETVKDWMDNVECTYCNDEAKGFHEMLKDAING
jgi:hypothetical protein